MTSKQRVHAALKRQPVDRVPIFMWFHPATSERLGRRLEIPADRVAEAFGNDVRQTWVGNNHGMEGIVHDRAGETHVDDWGVTWVKEGAFNQILASPLAGADDEAIRRYQFPYAAVERLLENLAPVVAAAGHRFFVGADISPCLFELINRLRSMEDALLDLAEPERARPLYRAAGRFGVHLATQVCERFPLDWLWTGDDVGGQTGMMMSPVVWRDLLKPLLREIFAVGKSRGLWVAFHSCGSIRPIIPDLIEIGLDVLNPIQGNCPGMDPLELKREYGRHLAFMGGVDTQDLLPRGSVAEVRRATRRLLDGMTENGGGYILAASHTVPPETPDENIFAMYEEAGISGAEILDRAAAIRASLV